MSNYNSKNWNISNMFLALIRKNKIRKIFKLDEEKVPF